MRRVCGDMTSRLAEFRHIDFDRVAIAVCQARKAGPAGMHASLTPMRFAGGRTYTVRDGRRYEVQRLLDPAGREMLYILSFYLPRFLDQPLREKIATVLHELWHISPRFDGDLRRHGGRCYLHTASQRRYDAAMERLADEWLAAGVPDDLLTVLDKSFDEVRREHGAVFGTRIPTPKLIPRQ